MSSIHKLYLQFQLNLIDSVNNFTNKNFIKRKGLSKSSILLIKREIGNEEQKRGKKEVPLNFTNSKQTYFQWLKNYTWNLQNPIQIFCFYTIKTDPFVFFSSSLII